MALSQFLPFAWNAAANVATQDQWEANPATLNGFMAGIARSRDCNKAWRQATMGVAALTWLIPDDLNEDAEDNGDRPKLTDQLRRSIVAIANSYAEVKNPPLGTIVWGRNGPNWVPSVGEAPADNITYGRRNNAWVRVVSWDEMGAYLPLAGGTLNGPGHLTMYGNLNVVGGLVAYPNSDTHVYNSLHVGANLNTGGQVAGGSGNIGGVQMSGFNLYAPGGINAGGGIGGFSLSVSNGISGNTVTANGITSNGNINAAGTVTANGITSNGNINAANTVTANDVTANGALRANWMGPSAGTTLNMQYSLVAAAINLSVGNHLSVTNGLCMGGSIHADYIISADPTTDANFWAGVIATHFTQSSDERYKTNITPTEPDALAAIRPIRFFGFDRPFADERMRVAPHHVDVGLLAQQVQQTMPDAVVETAEPIRPVDCDRRIGFDPCEVETRPSLAIDLMTLLTYSMRAIQQMADRIDALEAKG